MLSAVEEQETAMNDDERQAFRAAAEDMARAGLGVIGLAKLLPRDAHTNESSQFGYDYSQIVNARRQLDSNGVLSISLITSALHNNLGLA